MAASLNLKYVNGSTLLSLMDGTHYTVELGKEKIEIRTGEIQTAVFTVNVLGDTRTAAQTNLNTLVTTLNEAVACSTDDFKVGRVALSRTNDGENASGTLAVIINYDLKVRADLARGISQINSPWLTVDLALTLYGWERGASQSGTVLLNTPEGDLITDGGFVPVTAPAGFATRDSRMSVRIVPDSGAGVSKVWMGIQPYRFNDATIMAEFDPVWKLENGDLLTDATAVTGTDSLGTDVVEVDFATASMEQRTRISLADWGPSSYRAAFAGTFFPLLRCRVTDASTDVFMRLGGGYDSSEVAYNEVVRINGETDWVYIPMGMVKLPPRGARSINTLDVSGFWWAYDLYIDAELNAGTGELQLDAIVMVPYTHFISLENIKVDLASMDIYVHTHPDGRIETVNFGSSGYFGTPTVTGVNDWVFPYDNGNLAGVFVIVAQNSASASSNDVTVVITAYGGSVFYA